MISLFAYNRFVNNEVQCHKWKTINYGCHSNFNKVFGLAFFFFFQSGVTVRTDLLILNSSGSRPVLKFCIKASHQIHQVRNLENIKALLDISKTYVAKHNYDNSMYDSVSRQVERGQAYLGFEYILNNFRHLIFR